MRGRCSAVTTALAVWIGLALAGDAVAVWRAWVLDRQLRAPGSMGWGSLDDSAALLATADLLGVLCVVAAGLCVMVWLFEARENSDLISSIRQRWSAPWAVGGWLCPGLNLIVPKQLIDDLWRVCDPNTPRARGVLDGVPRPALVRAWWPLFVAFAILELLAPVEFSERTPLQVGMELIGRLVVSGLGIAAAVLAVRVVRRVTAFQETWRVAP